MAAITWTFAALLLAAQSCGMMPIKRPESPESLSKLKISSPKQQQNPSPAIILPDSLSPSPVPQQPSQKDAPMRRGSPPSSVHTRSDAPTNASQSAGRASPNTPLARQDNKFTARTGSSGTNLSASRGPSTIKGGPSAAHKGSQPSRGQPRARSGAPSPHPPPGHPSYHAYSGMHPDVMHPGQMSMLVPHPMYVVPDPYQHMAAHHVAQNAVHYQMIHQMDQQSSTIDRLRGHRNELHRTLTQEQAAHDETAHSLAQHKQQLEDTKAELVGSQLNHRSTQSSLEAEQLAHQSTKQLLGVKRAEHASANDALRRSRDEHAETRAKLQTAQKEAAAQQKAKIDERASDRDSIRRLRDAHTKTFKDLQTEQRAHKETKASLENEKKSHEFTQGLLARTSSDLSDSQRQTADAHARVRQVEGHNHTLLQSGHAAPHNTVDLIMRYPQLASPTPHLSPHPPDLPRSIGENSKYATDTQLLDHWNDCSNIEGAANEHCKHHAQEEQRYGALANLHASFPPEQGMSETEKGMVVGHYRGLAESHGVMRAHHEQNRDHMRNEAQRTGDEILRRQTNQIP